MRRMTALLGAAALAVPALISVTAEPAQAASGSVTVTTLTRAGGKITTQLTIMNLTTGSLYNGTSGKAVALPKGRYAVSTDIWNNQDDTDTLGAQVVTVSDSNVATTIDARKGKPLTVGLSSSPGTGYSQTLQAHVCGGSNLSLQMGLAGGSNNAGHMYVIPNASKDVQFGYLSLWQKGSDTLIAKGGYTGLPSAPGGTFARGNMTTVSVQARRGPQEGRYGSLYVEPKYTTCTTGMPGQLLNDAFPYTTTLHLTAGTWTLQAEDEADASGGTEIVGDLYRTVSAAPGTAPLSQIFYRSAWGPARTLPYVFAGRLGYDTGEAFDDPSTTGFEASERSTAQLSFGSTVLARGTVTDWGGPDSTFYSGMKSTGWYTLAVTSTRYRPGVTFPTNMLSTASSVKFHFKADPRTDAAVPGFLTQFVPGGLTLNNTATPHTTTAVALWVVRPSVGPNAPTPKDTVKSVKVYASNNGGLTWAYQPVKHSGSAWSVNIANPSSGAISLRSLVTDAAGDTTETTVYRAYALG
ncbi:hypothetical protein V2S66_25600 [Streptomyces sp. V4-01]|uniref:Uncharacterized protein n=1 Tax=Actinacidiphila polyblastidii TaxID=3110430 RepID=A0ABU7PHM0_9ACTN|nr:hypothetical protein [Streptomyces sp. V4-01]